MSSTLIKKKMLNIIKELKGVDENGFNIHHKYKYKRQEDIIDAIKPHLIENNLIVLSEIIEEESELLLNKYMYTKITVEFTITDLDSEQELVLKYKGHGIDVGDKALYKAITGAEKYFYMKNFLIGSPNDDPEFVPPNDINSEINFNDTNNINRNINNNQNKNTYQNKKIVRNNNNQNINQDNNNFNGNYNNTPKQNSNNINGPSINKEVISEEDKPINMRLQKLLFVAAKQEEQIVLNAIKKLGYTSTNQIKFKEFKKVLELIKAQVQLFE